EKPKRTLKAHQSAGLASWRANGRRGILAFVTGAGKTFTALDGIREALSLGEVPVVVVPDRLLFKQWQDELEPVAARAGARILKAGADHSAWRPLLGTFTAPGGEPRMVLATVQTARSEEFRTRLRGGPHLLLVADEVHRLGSRENRALLDDALFGARLGLSATPERAGDPEGTALLLGWFGGVLEPRYSLADAIRDGNLTRYFYNSHRVELTAAEADEWRAITRKIGRARAAAGDLQSGERTPGIDMLLFQRARIVKQAQAKVPLAVEVLREHYERGHRWIVYCDDRRQLDDVRAAFKAAGIDSMAYYADMPADRDATLQWFRDLGGVVVAIKCLDEGVDIPEIDHALILASSKNPREYIQRRGRVLRKSPGKVHAHIHDAVVVPPPAAPGSPDEGPDPITAGELARAVEFALGAANSGAEVDVARIAIAAGLHWQDLFSVGVEDDDDDA
ncbi:MAG TPA: DEAD/DEAH box helicase family protein, partial [Polyangia bacterium]